MNSTQQTRKLINLGAAEVAAYRNAGLAARATLVHMVTSALKPPPNWIMEGELQHEEDDFFPVLCRFIPPHSRFHVALCCPSDSEGAWLLVFIADEGEKVLILRQCDVFNPWVVNDSLMLTAQLDASGYLLDEVTDFLKLKSITKKSAN